MYTHDEINEMVSRKHGFGGAQVSQTEYSTAMDSLRKKLAEAVATGNAPGLVLQLERAISKLEKESALQKEVFDRATRKQVEVNRRNRENNVARDIAAGLQLKMEEQQTEGDDQKDPFTRYVLSIFNDAEPFSQQRHLPFLNVGGRLVPRYYGRTQSPWTERKSERLAAEEVLRRMARLLPCPVLLKRKTIPQQQPLIKRKLLLL